MRAPQRVVWSEGLFMTPQHLQQQDLYHEAFVAARVGALAPYDWGVLELELDTEALRSGQLQLLRFRGVLADGLPLAFERGQAEAPAARAVDEVQVGNRPLEVFLGVPKEREGQDSYAGDGGNARFAVANRNVADLAQAGSAVQVGFARANVKLVLGGEPRDDLECIKLAELVRDGTGAYAVSEAYVPPCLRASASPFILNGLRKLLRLMQGKQRELADGRRQRDASSLEFTAQDVGAYLQLSALNGTIPVLTHVVDAGDLHPHQVYLLLAQATGQLMTFSPEGDPSALPKFQFTNLRATFEALFERATALLKGLAREQSIAVPLETRAAGFLVGKLDERLSRCTQFILSVRSSLPEAQVADHFPRLSKIASASEIQGIVQAAAPGVPLTVTFRPPPEVPVKPGVVYFHLGTGDLYWRNVVRDRSVAIYLPQALDPTRTQLELLAIPTAGA